MRRSMSISAVSTTILALALTSGGTASASPLEMSTPSAHHPAAESASESGACGRLLAAVSSKAEKQSNVVFETCEKTQDKLDEQIGRALVKHIKTSGVTPSGISERSISNAKAAQDFQVLAASQALGWVYADKNYKGPYYTDYGASGPCGYQGYWRDVPQSFRQIASSILRNNAMKCGHANLRSVSPRIDQGIVLPAPYIGSIFNDNLLSINWYR